MKKSLRPTSVLQLALIAFALVGLPLGVALVTATLAMDRLASQSRDSVLQAARAIDSGRGLVEELTAMERIARQFQLLGDEDLFDAYLGRRSLVLQAFDVMERRAFADEYRQVLTHLRAEEQRIFDVLSTTPPGSAAAADAIGQFPMLGEDARLLLAESSRAIAREVGELRDQTERAQRRLFWEALIVIPAALLMAILGTILIARPIRQIDRAIRRLGRGEFEAPVQIQGPRDLEELGERLDWLRLRLLDLDAQKVRFLRHVSHELKTPLTAIREGTQLLSDGVVGSLTPAQDEIADILCNSSIQLQRRIEDLLSFNTILQGAEPPVSREPVNLASLLDQVLQEQVVSIRAKALEIDASPTAPVVPGNREQLRIMLDNLVSNAIKYSPPGGRIEVRMREIADCAAIEVHDEGPGICKEERSRVFEPFYQGSAVHDGHVKGTGLGLAITQEFVRAHGGNIEIAEVQRGTCVRVQLPLHGDTIAEGGLISQ